MDALPLPVLSVWTAADGDPTQRLPDLPDRVSGHASTPAQALARAAEQFPGRDVLLLRADAELPEAWLPRLLAAWHAGDWDALSPLDGRWNVFPDGLDATSADALAWTCGDHLSLPWNQWSDICSLWRGNLPLGSQGPEAAHRCALLPCVRIGPAFAIPELDRPPAIARLAERISQRAGRPGLPPSKPAVLHVLHNWGGGARHFVRDLARGDTERQHLVLVADSIDDRAPLGKQLRLYADLDSPPLRTWPLINPIAETALHSEEVQSVLDTVLPEWGIGAVLVSSLIGHSLDVLRTGLPTTICVHDAYPVWPLLHDPRDPAQAPFDLPELGRQLAQLPSGHSFTFQQRDPAAWWSLRDAFLAAATDHPIGFVAPSDFARRRLCAMAPALAERPWQVIPHGLASFPDVKFATAPREPGEPLRVLVPGRLDGGKGEHLIADMLDTLPDGVELMLLGCGHASARFSNRRNVRVQRDYVRDQLPVWVANYSPHLALLPSTVPETFSYTLSEMLSLELPVLCVAPGAPSERLREGGGWTVAAEPIAVNAELARIARDPSVLDEVRFPVQPGLETMAAAWRDALAVAPVPLSFAAASRETISRLALESDSLRQQLRLRSQDEELQRRADWAQSLQREQQRLQGLLDDRSRVATPLGRALDDHDLEIARLEDYIVQLDQQLAEAHGYYQRDSTDLANQRDIAIRQRDDVVSRLKRIEESRLWRLSAPLRWVLGGLRDRVSALGYHFNHLRSLTSRGIASLRVRGIRGTLQRIRERRRAPRPVAIAPVATTQTERSLRLPRPQSPRASIIVPVHNHLHFSLACLRALADSGDSSSFEVIVVDDASTDSTPQVLPSVPGLRYHRNAQNLGFIGACNAGAEMAQGTYVVFLNNDTTVQPGWLDSLLATFDAYPDTGLAGSKLVYPDGRLQEAGGIVFSDGSGWNYGRFEDPSHPRYNFVREVDYCSGAAIALRRHLFMELGGFDSHYAPAYYEDTDLAMRVREHGLKVRYQPASVVIHYEGVTSGTDLKSGVKAYQVVNHQKFLERWRDELAASHAAPGSDPERASERGRRQQVLVLDACTPTPDRDSGSVRMLALLRLLREQGCAVVFFAENRAYDGDYTVALQQMGIEAWWNPHIGDVPRWLAKNGPRFDRVIVSRHYVLSPLLTLLRLHARRATLVFDTVDLHFLREQREAELSGDPAQQRAAARTRKVELGLIAQCDRTWVVSEVEKALLATEVPRAKVDVVSNIHAVGDTGRPWIERRDLLFVGSYRHPPNVDAVLWLAREILPRIREHLPDVMLDLVGGDAPDAITELDGQPGIRFHGYVPDLQPLLETARISVAPLRYGAGVKGKVNQSLAHGLPVVATACAIEAMHLVDGEDVLVADEPDAFADAVVRLYNDETLWRQLVAGGLENTRRFFSTEPVRAVLVDLLSKPGRA